jgi:hypothetical protein
MGENKINRRLVSQKEGSSRELLRNSSVTIDQDLLDISDVPEPKGQSSFDIIRDAFDLWIEDGFLEKLENIPVVLREFSGREKIFF